MKTLSMLILGCAFAVAMSAATSEAQSGTDQATERPLVIVSDGEAQATIVIRDDAFEVERFAAEEFRHHVRRATGVTLEIALESDWDGGTGAVFIGRTNAAQNAGIDFETLADAGHVVLQQDGALYLAGDDTPGPVLEEWHWQLRHGGTLYAVYTFLNEQMGVRWVWPGELGEVIPRHESLVIEPMRQEGQPRLAYSRFKLQKNYVTPYGWSDAQSMEAFRDAERLWLVRNRYGATRPLALGHAFSTTNPYWQRFKDSHREYFALLPDGTRRPLEGDPHGEYVTLCVSEPGLWKRAAEEGLAKRRWPNEPVSACENDSPGMCTCDRCRVWDAADPAFETSRYWAGGEIPTRSQRFDFDGLAVNGNSPSLSDRYATFYLRVQDQVQQLEPSAKVYGFAYANYTDPPKHTKLNNDIVISFVPGWVSDWGGGLTFPITDQKVEQFKQQWSGWVETGAEMFYRPNYTSAGANMPIDYAMAHAAMFKHLIDNGAVGVYYDSLYGQWATQGPTLYMIGRLNIDPSLDPIAVLDEYMSAFGPAKPQVEAYFDYWRSVCEAVDVETFAQWRAREDMSDHKNWLVVADEIFTPAVMQQGRALLASAVQAASDDPRASERVGFLEAGLRHAELTLDTLRAYRISQAEPSAKHAAELESAKRALWDYRAQVEHLMIADMGYLAGCENRIWGPPQP